MYISTRNNYERVSASQAIKLGMVPPGGLFVPEKTPGLNLEQIVMMKTAGYQETAVKILSLYLDDYTHTEIETSVQKAYQESNFPQRLVAPLHQINKQAYILELWHGPTAAFKDMALQVMPHLLSQAMKKSQQDKEIVILVATSGDTGKAALEGFKNVPGIKIIVFYPYQGVSKVQELQMSTTDGNNTYVVAVKGNFDDCQNAVKEIFGDQGFKAQLATAGYELSSANSINWGRLAPQIVYYFYAYSQLLRTQAVQPGEPINFVVPTGNFGNILAGWYAYRMGLPVRKFICASNENKVLTDFFASGVYNRNREFKQTNSPSMDILISSNLERFLFEITGHNGEQITRWMKELQAAGTFALQSEDLKAIQDILAAGSADEKETLAAIGAVFHETGYALDTHTAVGVSVYEKYARKTQDHTVTVIAATASPFKFNNSVLEAIKGPQAVRGKDEFRVLEELSQAINQPIHHGLKELEHRPVLHRRVCAKSEIKAQVEDILGIK